MGPGLLVTAAFIGPGTVLTASGAGAQFGGGLLWVVVVSVLAAVVLQEMAARLGLVTRRELGQVLVGAFPSPLIRRLTAILILSAILIGNTAYQAGNFTGAAAGLEVLTGGSAPVRVALVALVAGIVLSTGAYASLQWILVILVVAMSFLFLASAGIEWPQLRALPAETFRPSLPEAGIWSVVALLGTTVVPYNLFLHARTVQEKWPEKIPLQESLREARWDTAIAVAIGGVVTASILLTAVVTFHVPGVELRSLAQMADQLAPVAGGHAKGLFALGLLAAGLTSAITAPLAAAFVTAGCLGWEIDWRGWRFRGVALGVVAIGAAVAILVGDSPRALLLFAQAANGLLLPIVALFLVGTMNRSSILGTQVNGWRANVMGGGVVLLVAALGLSKLFRLW